MNMRKLVKGLLQDRLDWPAMAAECLGWEVWLSGPVCAAVLGRLVWILV